MRFGGGGNIIQRNEKGATFVAPLLFDCGNYGFLVPLAIESLAALSAFAFIVESALAAESIAAGAAAGAGAIAGVCVSVAAESFFEQAVIARTAATNARRFMLVS